VNRMMLCFLTSPNQLPKKAVRGAPVQKSQPATTSTDQPPATPSDTQPQATQNESSDSQSNPLKPKKSKISKTDKKSNESESASDSPAPSRLKQSQEFGNPLQAQEIGISESPLSAPPALPPRSSRSRPVDINSLEPSSSPQPSRSLFDSEGSEEEKESEPNSDLATSAPSSFATGADDILTFDHEPYRRAIQSLKKLSSLKSPRDKLGCILITFMDIIQCVTDFWEVHDREPVVGADDLVPIFSYVILKARVPKLYSEMSYIWEFATDAEMKGKYGYGFATFQIGVEVVARLTIDELERKQKKEAPPKPTPTPPVTSDTESDSATTKPEVDTPSESEPLQFEGRTPPQATSSSSSGTRSVTPKGFQVTERAKKQPFGGDNQTSGSDVDIPFLPSEFEPKLAQTPPTEGIADQPETTKDATESQSESSWEFVSNTTETQKD